MKPFIWICCLSILLVSCKNAQHEIDPGKAELLEDEDFKQYIKKNVSLIYTLESMGKDEDFRKLSKKEKGTAFANLVTDNDSRESSSKTQLYYYQKIHRKYILKNKFSSEEIKSIVMEEVRKEISRRNKLKKAKQ